MLGRDDGVVGGETSCKLPAGETETEQRLMKLRKIKITYEVKRENLPAVSPPKLATTGLGLIKTSKEMINMACFFRREQSFSFLFSLSFKSWLLKRAKHQQKFPNKTTGNYKLSGLQAEVPPRKIKETSFHKVSFVKLINLHCRG